MPWAMLPCLGTMLSSLADSMAGVQTPWQVPHTNPWRRVDDIDAGCARGTHKIRYIRIISNIVVTGARITEK